MKDDFPSSEGLHAAAWFLLCEERAIRAVAKVEAGPEGAFNMDGTPVILYERHIFDELTKGRFRGALAPGIELEHAQLSQREWGGYGRSSIQHAKLQAAGKLDHSAALMACSWGLYQILGRNHWRCGFGTKEGDAGLQRFITAMYRSADDHLRALIIFIRRDERLVDAIRLKAWASFAYAYNGPKYADNRYDQKLADAYGSLA